MKYGQEWFSSADSITWREISAEVFNGFGSTSGWSLSQKGPQIFLFNSTNGEYYTSQNYEQWNKGKLSVRSGFPGDYLRWDDKSNLFIFTNPNGNWATSNDAVSWSSQAPIANGLIQVSSDGNNGWLAMLATQSLTFPSDAIILKKA